MWYGASTMRGAGIAAGLLSSQKSVGMWHRQRVVYRVTIVCLPAALAIVPMTDPS